jgi:LytS/YehU family sensor histidine kinase
VMNKKISELNLKALRSQMNPHFTFNVLNSIQYYVAKKDTEQALQFITKFSRLIRTILDQSRNLYITLEEEINLLRLYLELEKLRFEDKFSFSISADEGLNLQSVKIPGMLIQPFVENAIKHGLQFKKGEAHIAVYFEAGNSGLLCRVIDNGIGRKAAAIHVQSERHKSAGTAIVNERMEALNILYDNNLKSSTEDLTDGEGNATGTAVTIEIPYKSA